MVLIHTRKMDRLEPLPLCPFDVISIIIDKKRFFRLNTKFRAYIPEYRRITFALMDPVRIEDPVKVREETGIQVYLLKPVCLIAQHGNNEPL